MKVNRKKIHKLVKYSSLELQNKIHFLFSPLCIIYFVSINLPLFIYNMNKININ